jgi:hypothetical protein
MGPPGAGGPGPRGSPGGRAARSRRTACGSAIVAIRRIRPPQAPGQVSGAYGSGRVNEQETVLTHCTPDFCGFATWIL